MANEGQKGHQRQELQKIINFIDIQCKIVYKWECNAKKVGYNQTTISTVSDPALK